MPLRPLLRIIDSLRTVEGGGFVRGAADRGLSTLRVVS